jgi:hypothetical protein
VSCVRNRWSRFDNATLDATDKEVAMECRLLGLAAVLLSATGSAHAQQPSAAMPAHSTFVLTGCLEAAPRVDGRFALTRAEAVGQAPPIRATAGKDAVGTSGQSTTYVLQPVTALGKTGANAETLKAHIGQRVRVQVRLIESPAPAPPPAAVAKADQPVGETPPDQYSVTEITRVEGNCP